MSSLNIVNIKDFKKPPTKLWVTAPFIEVRINGIFRCGGNWWARVGPFAALKYIRECAWAEPKSFSSKEKIITIEKYLQE